MDPISLLLLQWQGISLTSGQIWELLSLKPLAIEPYLRSQSISLQPDWLQKIKKDKELCEQNALKLLPIWHPHYPNGLKHLDKPPMVLCCSGNTSRLLEPSVAIVGSRKMNYQSSQWMEKEITHFLQNSEFQVMSGGAIGVDQKAHTLCALHNRPTVCWLPSGLLDIYPSQLRTLVPDILSAGGLFVTTYSPLQRMRKFHFVQRNQFIAACSELTFIIQAKRKSGTLITARAAADYGKEVAVLPSAPNEEGLGGLDLLMDGAHLVRDAEDLLYLTHELMVKKSSPLEQAKEQKQ